MNKYNQLLRILFSCIFIIIIALPLILLSSGVIMPRVQINERRMLAKKPAFSKNNYQSFPKEFENYINDNIPFRTQFIAHYMKFWEMNLGSYVRENIKGKDNQYFPNSADAPTISRYCGLKPLSLQQLYLFKTVIAGRQVFWEDNGAKYIYILVPDKSTLYPEYLPKWIKYKYSWYDQLYGSIINTPIHYLDINNVLQKHKMINEPFYNNIYDINHWNGNALDIAYQSIVEILNKNLKSLPKIANSYAITPKEVFAEPYTNELVHWMDLNENDLIVKDHNYVGSLDQWQKCNIVINSKIGEGTLLLSSDSYFKATHQNLYKPANGYIFPLAHNVNKFIQVHYNEQFQIIKDITKNEKPDIVIESSVERMGTNITNSSIPVLLIAGENLLKDSRYTITPDGIITGNLSTNCLKQIEGENINLIASTNDPMLFLPTQFTNRDGRFVVMAKILVQEPTYAQLFYAQDKDDFNEKNSIKQTLKKGINYIYMPIYALPNREIRFRFDPGYQKGIYSICPMPSTKKMFEEEI